MKNFTSVRRSRIRRGGWPALTLALVLGAARSATAFSLYPANPPRYGTHDVPLRIVPGDCTNAGLTNAQLQSFVEKAIGRYWNLVPTASLKLHVGDAVAAGAVPATSPSLEELAAAAGTDEIVVGCSSNAKLFTSGSTLAVGGIVTQGAAHGAVAINDTPATLFTSLDEDTKLSVFAHELGHALGLGHSSIEYALMYYAVSDDVQQRALSQDDADALTYLYPLKGKAGGFGGACGTLGAAMRDGPHDRGGGPPSPLATILASGMIFAAGWVLSRRRLRGARALALAPSSPQA